MTARQGRRWSKDEIILLEKMLRHRTPMREMTRVLRRNSNSIIHASRNILIQQCLRHPSKKVAKYHQINLNNLRANLVPEKYYIIPKKARFPYLHVLFAGAAALAALYFV